MSRNLRLFNLTLLLLAVFSYFSATTAVCCHSHYNRLCADCSRPETTMLGLVGYCPAVEGDCNYIGCNCVNGCRQPPEGKKACAPTAHLFHPKLARSDKNCWLMRETETCNGREFYRTNDGVAYKV